MPRLKKQSSEQRDKHSREHVAEVREDMTEDDAAAFREKAQKVMQVLREKEDDEKAGQMKAQNK